MTILTKPLGGFPLGIWIVLVILAFTGLVFTLFGQGLSVFAWDTAVEIGMQEDSRYSANPVEKTMGAVSWGEAGADLLVQGTLIALTLLGIFRRKPYGLFAGCAESVILIYVTPMVLLQRVALYLWGLESDLSRFGELWAVMIFLALVPGAIMLVCLIANMNFFGVKKIE